MITSSFGDTSSKHYDVMTNLRYTTLELNIIKL
jgi:hypothetical protein